MARLEGARLDRHSWLARLWLRLVFWMTRRRLGRIVEPVRLAAHHPRLLAGLGAMEQVLGESRYLAAGVRERVQLRVAARIGCPF
jgi:alkylhydroperoxidase family enzyme